MKNILNLLLLLTAHGPSTTDRDLDKLLVPEDTCQHVSTTRIEYKSPNGPFPYVTKTVTTMKKGNLKTQDIEIFVTPEQGEPQIIQICKSGESWFTGQPPVVNICQHIKEAYNLPSNTALNFLVTNRSTFYS